MNCKNFPFYKQILQKFYSKITDYEAINKKRLWTKTIMQQWIRTVYKQNRLWKYKFEQFMNGLNFPFYKHATKI